MSERPARRVGLSPGRLAARRLARNPAAIASLALIVGMVALAALAPAVSPYGYDQADSAAQLLRPCRAHLMGTDFLGRDLFTRLVFGARVSLGVAVASTLISLLVGSGYGAVSGYVGGRLDNALMRVVDVIYSFPDLLLIIIIGASLNQERLGAFLGHPGRSLLRLSELVLSIPGPAVLERLLDRADARVAPVLGLFLTADNLALLIALSLVTWVYVARLIRGEVLRLREEKYVEAARALGVGHAGIIVRHLLPNTLGPLIVTLTFRIPAVILAESTLSFIGLGIQPPKSSWGTLAADGFTSMQFHWHLIFFPSLAIFLTMLAFNFLGDGLRDALAPERRS
jgi:oligopeptide transport system permease protein